MNEWSYTSTPRHAFALIIVLAICTQHDIIQLTSSCSIAEADWESYFEFWDWLRRTLLCLRPACGSKIRYCVRHMESKHCTLSVSVLIYLPQTYSPTICYWPWCQYTVNVAVKFIFPLQFQRPAFLRLDSHFTKTLVLAWILNICLCEQVEVLEVFV